VIFARAAGHRLQERRTAWHTEVAAKLTRLEGRVGNFEHLLSQDTFMDALTTASQIADRTSREEKLALLRNAVVNSVMPDAPDDDRQQVFFDLLDRFTPTHVRMLTLLSYPFGWFEDHDISLSTFHAAVETGRKMAVVEAGMPELAGRPDLIDRYGEALNAAGLIDQSLTRVLSFGTMVSHATTSLGDGFLSFVTDPESKVG
jgi:hypothetical protein